MENKADPNIDNQYGFTPLEESSMYSTLPIFKELEKHSYRQNRVLFYSCRNPQTEILQYLINKFGKDILYTRYPGENKGLPIHFAAEKGYPSIIKYLISQGVSLNVRDAVISYLKIGGEYSFAFGCLHWSLRSNKNIIKKRGG